MLKATYRGLQGMFQYCVFEKQQTTKTHPPNILVFVIIDLVLFNVQRLQERLSRQDVDLTILYFSIFAKRGPKPKLKLKRA